MDFAINIFHAARQISEGTMIFCQMPPETGRHDPPRYPLISLFAFFVPRTIFLLIVEENLMAHFFVNFSGRKKNTSHSSVSIDFAVGTFVLRLASAY